MRALCHSRRGKERAFSMIEMLVATAVFVVMLTLLLGMISNASQIWQRSEGQKNRQQAARRALEMIARDMESAVFPANTNGTTTLQFQVNPGLPGYENPSAAFWQAAASAESNGSDLSDVGYFVAWTTNQTGDAQGELRRYRLAATNTDASFQLGANFLSTGKLSTHAPGSDDAATQQGLVSQNIIGLWITLFTRAADGTAGTNDSLTPYDSRSVPVPPRPTSAEIAVAVIDPRAARRITNSAAITALYTTNADDLATAFNNQFGGGVQIFKSRVILPAAQP